MYGMYVRKSPSPVPERQREVGENLSLRGICLLIHCVSINGPIARFSPPLVVGITLKFWMSPPIGADDHL